jgi:hypothetical protein
MASNDQQTILSPPKGSDDLYLSTQYNTDREMTEFQEENGNVISPLSQAIITTDDRFEALGGDSPETIGILARSLIASSSSFESHSSSSFHPHPESLSNLPYISPSSSSLSPFPEPPVSSSSSTKRLKAEVSSLRQAMDGVQESVQTLSGNLKQVLLQQRSIQTPPLLSSREEIKAFATNKIAPTSLSSFPRYDDSISSLGSRSIDDIIQDCSNSSSSSISINSILEKQTSSLLKSMEKELQQERERKNLIRERLKNLQKHPPAVPIQQHISRNLSFESTTSPQANRRTSPKAALGKKGLRLVLVGLAVLSLLYLQSFWPAASRSKRSKRRQRIRFRNKQTVQQLIKSCDNPNYESLSYAQPNHRRTAQLLHPVTQRKHSKVVPFWGRMTQYFQQHLLHETGDTYINELVFWL